MGFLLVTLVPAFLFYIIFTLWPNILSVYYSLLDWNGISDAKFVGLKNFIDLAQDRYLWTGLSVSLSICIVTVPLTMIVGLLLAFILTNTKSKLATFYQTLFYFPNIIPVVVIALLWSFIFDGNMGLLNAILQIVNPEFAGEYWLASKSTALICIMIPIIWCNVGFHMIIYINAMKSIPPSMYEVATLSGASMLQKMRYVTLPLIRKSLITSATFLILNAFKTFELIMLMTNGGPNGSTYTLSLYMYTQAFGATGVGGYSVRRYGYASAIGMVLMIVTFGVKFIMDRFVKDNDDIQY